MQTNFETLKRDLIWGTYGKGGVEHCAGRCPLHRLQWVKLKIAASRQNNTAVPPKTPCSLKCVRLNVGSMKNSAENLPKLLIIRQIKLDAFSLFPVY